MTGTPETAGVARKIFLIATEESGDRLGASLMKVLRQRLGGAVRFEGVGGQAMAREGLASLFPIEELSIMGFAAVVKQLPMILRRIRETAEAVTQASPDMLVIIDSPDFTHRVARRVRASDPAIPIVNYVSPSVWAWRPGRARAMCAYVDHVLALLPFEPGEYLKLRGPPCSYVGHPLTEQIESLRPAAHEQKRRDEAPPVLLVLPGSRRSEVRHHMAVFGAALGLLRDQGVAFELILPTMPHLVDAVREGAASWPVQPRIVIGETEKRAAFRIAHAALAKSGTVTLELALAGVPMVTAYRTGAIEAWIMLTRDPDQFGDPGQPRGRRQRRAGIPASRLHAAKPVARAPRRAAGFAVAAAAGRGVCKNRRDHVDRQRDAEHARGRYRAGDDAEGAGRGLIQRFQAGMVRSNRV